MVDKVVAKKVTIYAAGASSARAGSIAIVPFAARGRKGVQLALRF